jgi:hypothetical protein
VIERGERVDPELSTDFADPCHHHELLGMEGDAGGHPRPDDPPLGRFLGRDGGELEVDSSIRQTPGQHGEAGLDRHQGGRLVDAQPTRLLVKALNSLRVGRARPDLGPAAVRHRHKGLETLLALGEGRTHPNPEPFFGKPDLSDPDPPCRRPPLHPDPDSSELPQRRQGRLDPVDGDRDVDLRQKLEGLLDRGRVPPHQERSAPRGYDRHASRPEDLGDEGDELGCTPMLRAIGLQLLPGGGPGPGHCQ